MANRIHRPSGTCNDEDEGGKRKVRVRWLRGDMARLGYFVSHMGGRRMREERSIIASRRIADWVDRQAEAAHERVKRGSRRRARSGERWEKRTNLHAG